MTTHAIEHPVFAPGRLGPVELRNRVVKCGTNEAMSREGLVTDELVEWHRRFAVGGVGMTTLAYCSVAAEGRTYRHQLWMREEALEGLTRFTRAMHDEGARAAIQLGHAGWFAVPRVIGGPPRGPSRQFSPHAQTFSRAMTEDDLARVTDEFARAAALAGDAGFDALEVHCGHGYLLSQFLSPWNNRRTDRWGGDLEGRARFPRQVLAAVRAAAPDVAVYAKLNMEDGFRGGMPLHEGVAVGRMLEADGSVDALQLTGGHTTKSPMFLMRGDTPMREMAREERSLVRRVGMEAFTALLVDDYAFEEAFLLPAARQFRTELELPLVLLGGITKLETMDRAMELGFDFVAMGRALIREPDLVARMQKGETTEGVCIPCNRCVVEMERHHTRCVFRDDP